MIINEFDNFIGESSLIHGSFFSGIGGFDIAADEVGFINKFHVEINPFCNKVLNYYWPNAESFTDIKKSNFKKYAGRIDVVSGGFPCQPYSLAGKRKGKEDERHLWPEMLRAIKEIFPRWVVGENVFGIINWNGGLVFDEVQTDLEAAGYEVLAFVLPACSVNAPHRRDRVWFIAHAEGGGRRRCGNCNKSQGCGCSKETQFVSGCSDATNTNSNGFNGSNSEHEVNSSERGFNALSDIEHSGEHGAIADTNNARNATLQYFNKLKQTSGLQERKFSFNKFNGSSNKRDVAHAGNEQLQGSFFNREFKKTWQIESEGGQFIGSICNAWEKFPTQSPVCGGNDGLPKKLDGITFSKWRNESIKAYGNAIVPQVAIQIFKAIKAYEEKYYGNK